MILATRNLRNIIAFSIVTALCACSAPEEPPYQAGTGSGDPTSGDSSGSGTAAETGVSSGQRSGTASGSGGGTSGRTSGSTGSSSGGGSTGSGESGLDASAPSGSQAGTSGQSASGASGSSGSSSPVDAGNGVMHRDASVPVLTGCAAQVPSAVFGASCEGKACHNSVDHEYGLDLQSSGLVSRLLNQRSLELPAIRMIDPVAPDNSYILLKVKLAQPPAGVQMPQMGSKLSSSQVQCLQQWVETVATGPY
jgi:hypothetical protein